MVVGCMYSCSCNPAQENSRVVQDMQPTICFCDKYDHSTDPDSSCVGQVVRHTSSPTSYDSPTCLRCWPWHVHCAWPQHPLLDRCFCSNLCSMCELCGLQSTCSSSSGTHVQQHEPRDIRADSKHSLHCSGALASHAAKCHTSLSCIIVGLPSFLVSGWQTCNHLVSRVAGCMLWGLSSLIRSVSALIAAAKPAALPAIRSAATLRQQSVQVRLTYVILQLLLAHAAMVCSAPVTQSPGVPVDCEQGEGASDCPYQPGMAPCYVVYKFCVCYMQWVCSQHVVPTVAMCTCSQHRHLGFAEHCLWDHRVLVLIVMPMSLKEPGTP